MELADDLCAARPGLAYTDERDSGAGLAGLADFTLREGGLNLPIM